MARTSLLLLAAVALPLEPAHAACTWVESVTGWNGSLAWSYHHQASWSSPPDAFEGQTQDQLSATFQLDSTLPGQAAGLMEGTMVNFGHVDITGIGAPGYTEHHAHGPFDAYAPPPPQVMLFTDPINCTYTFLYGPDLGADGTYSTKTGPNINTAEGVVEPGELVIPGMIPIPELPQPLTFSGQVEVYAEQAPLPPIEEPYYIPPDPAYDSAEALGDGQLGTASAQWAFQPDGFTQPLNDACAAAAATSSIVQDVTFATTSPSDPTPTCGAGDRSVWFLVQAAESGVASVATLGSDYDPIVSVWPMAQPCGAITTEVACGDGSAQWNVEEGETYRVQVTRGSGGGGSLIAVVSVPEPDVGTAAVVAALLLARARRRRPRSRTCLPRCSDSE